MTNSKAVAELKKCPPKRKAISIAIVPVAVFLCALFLRGVVIAANLSNNNNKESRPLNYGKSGIDDIDPFVIAQQQQQQRVVDTTRSVFSTARSRHHPAAADDDDDPAEQHQLYPTTTRTTTQPKQAVALKKKISGKHPALTIEARSHHQRYDNDGSNNNSASLFDDLNAYHRSLLERNWEQIGTDINGDGAAGDAFGISISMSADGKRLAICSYQHNNRGLVRVFDDNGMNWVQVGPDITAESFFHECASVSLSADGKRVAMGTTIGPGSIAYVRVFSDDGSWTQLGQKLQGVDGTKTEASFNFGGSVSMSDDGQRVVVGANGDWGYVQVFSYDGSSWTKLGQDVDGQVDNERFGVGVSISASGNRFVAGAYGTTPDGKGLARVYEYNSTAWVQLGLDILGEAQGDSSGFRVDISDDGERVAIGSPWNDAKGDNTGHVKVFDFSGTSWEQVGQDIDGDAAGDLLSWSVSLSHDGNKVAIGAKHWNNHAGYVKVFEYNGAAWVQLGQRINGVVSWDECGYSASMSTLVDRLAIGCPGSLDRNNGLTGRVQVYELPQLPAIFDLAVTLDSVAISLTNNTDFSEAIVFQYSYTGNTRGEDPRLSFTYDIQKGDCETLFAPYGNKSMALYFNDFDDETINNKVIAKLGINLTTIEVARDVWFQDNGETQAVLKFCGVWNIYVNDVLFQFHESNVTATINLKEDDGFSVADVNVGLDRKDANALNEDVDIEFPVDVFFCNDTASKTDPAPTGFNQGDPIQVCLELETPTANVFVQSIQALNYSATEVNTTVPLIEDGALKYAATAEFDCSQIAGVCRVRFIAVAAFFVNTPNNNLFIEGLAMIAFGADLDSRRQMVAFAGHSEDDTRRMQQDGGAELVPFEFIVGKLEPGSSAWHESVGSENYILISVVVACGVILILAVVAFFVYRRRKRMGDTIAVVTEEKAAGLDRDETREDSSSACSQPPADRLSHLEQNMSSGSDGPYEIVEV